MYSISLNQVTKHYSEKTVVNQAEINIRQGEIFGLLGANGAGKTTTMRMVLGLIAPDQGKITWFGKSYTDQLRRVIGYLPEERGLYPKIKVSEQILYFAELRGITRAQADKNLKDWLSRFNISEYYDKRVEELSKGNQQKIQFIAAVIHNPQLLILDEVFSGLDPVNVELLKATIKNIQARGTTILFSSHRMEHVEELCENICMLHKGNTVLQGSLREIKNTYPRERVLLETDQNVNGFESLTGVTDVQKSGRKYNIRINDSRVAKEIMALASSQAEIFHFQIMEPSLNEIFISKVGGVIE